MAGEKVKALSVPGLTTDADVQWLAARARGCQTIIEVGSYLGRTTRALADASEGLVYTIDLFEWPGFIGQVRDLIFAGRVLPLLDTPDLPRPLQDVRADLLWIDGGHDVEDVRRDLARYVPLVRPGGLVCGHDYSKHHPGVIQAVDQRFGRVSHLRTLWWVTV